MTTKVIQPESLKDPRPRYSQGIQSEGGSLLFIAGQTAADGERALVPTVSFAAPVATPLAPIALVALTTDERAPARDARS